MINSWKRYELAKALLKKVDVSYGTLKSPRRLTHDVEVNGGVLEVPRFPLTS
jgi:hypothetical protein